MNILIEILIHLICLIPTAEEVYNDRNGDKHSDNWNIFSNRNNWDIFRRCLACIAYPAAAWYISKWLKYHEHSFLQIVTLCVTMFILLFDYTVAYVLYRRKIISDPRWWQKINKTSWPDNWAPWVKIGWKWRMAVKVLIFIGGEIIYWL